MNNELNEALNNKWATVGVMLMYHTVYLSMQSKYHLLAGMALFFIEISYKFFKLNTFMNNKVKLADLYKKNPEKT